MAWYGTHKDGYMEDMMVKIQVLECVVGDPPVFLISSDKP